MRKFIFLLSPPKLTVFCTVCGCEFYPFHNRNGYFWKCFLNRETPNRFLIWFWHSVAEHHSLSSIYRQQSDSEYFIYYILYVRNYSFEDFEHSNHNLVHLIKGVVLVSKALKNHSDLGKLQRVRLVNSYGYTNTHWKIPSFWWNFSFAKRSTISYLKAFTSS